MTSGLVVSYTLTRRLLNLTFYFPLLLLYYISVSRGTDTPGGISAAGIFMPQLMAVLVSFYLVEGGCVRGFALGVMLVWSSGLVHAQHLHYTSIYILTSNLH